MPHVHQKNIPMYLYSRNRTNTNTNYILWLIFQIFKYLYSSLIKEIFEISSFMLCLDVFEFLRFGRFFFVFQENRVLGYSWSTLPWHRCYYLHRSRDALLSPVCGIFSITSARTIKYYT